MIKAKPCPFCRERKLSTTLTDGIAQVTCPNCYAAGPAIGPLEQGMRATLEEKLAVAIKFWNRRPLW